jgi:hypothetical protein
MLTGGSYVKIALTCRSIDNIKHYTIGLLFLFYVNIDADWEFIGEDSSPIVS